MAREMTYTQILTAKNRGLRVVVNMTWDNRDTGGEYLVVERGHFFRVSEMCDVYTDTGRLVATSKSLRGAEARATRARDALRKQGVSGLVDIVRRDDVVLRQSNAAYGCFSGQGSA